MILISSNPSSLMISQDKSTLRDALLVIQKSKEKIALIVDNSNKKLIATVTDGDIRRALLNGRNLDSIASKSVNKDFISINKASEELSLIAANVIRRKGIRQLPVIDDQGLIADLYYIDDTVIPLPNSVVFMAGGRGTRLRPHTVNCPKPMIQVGGKPMLEILLEHCIATGLSNFYISVNYLKEQVIDYFQDGSKWGVNINYLIEEEPLGTAGSLALLPKTLSEPFLVMNGDVLTRLNPSHLIEFHQEHNTLATLCVREHSFTVPFGVVQNDEFRLVAFEEKPTFQYLINAGVYVLNPSILSILSNNKCIDMPSLLQLAQDKGHQVSVCPIHEYWIDVGNPESLKEAHLSWEISKLS